MRILSFLWLVFRDSSLAVLLILLLIISVAFSEDGVSFQEFETNGNMYEDVIIIPDSELKQTDSREVSNIKVEKSLEITEVDTAEGFIERSEELNPYDYKIDPSIQSTKSLYEGFVDKLDSMRDELISPTSTANETSISDTMEDKRVPLSPFTPTTFDALREEIKRNSDNIAGMEPVISYEVRSDVKEKLLQERKYLLT